MGCSHHPSKQLELATIAEFGFWLVGLLDVFALLCLTDTVIDFDLFYFLLLTFSFLSMCFLFELNWPQNKCVHLKRVFFLLFFFSPVRAKLAGGPTFLGKAV